MSPKAKLSPKELHDLAVKYIAEVRFTRPNNEFYAGKTFPTWKTYTNSPVKTMPVPHKWKGNLYPDVVVVDSARCNCPELIAEVEMAEDLAEGKEQGVVDGKWFYDFDCTEFIHIYVPEGYAMRAAGLCVLAATSRRTFSPKGIRTYGLDENGNIRITHA